MRAVDLHIPSGKGISTRPVAGPGSPVPETGFCLWTGRVDAVLPVVFQPLAEVVEQVFFVTGGHGKLEYES